MEPHSVIASLADTKGRGFSGTSLQLPVLSVAGAGRAANICLDYAELFSHFHHTPVACLLIDKAASDSGASSPLCSRSIWRWAGFFALSSSSGLPRLSLQSLKLTVEMDEM